MADTGRMTRTMVDPRRLEAARLRRGYSQAELAGATGISRGHIARMETGGVTRVATHRLQAIADVLNLRIEDLERVPQVPRDAGANFYGQKLLESYREGDEDYDDLKRVLEQILRRRSFESSVLANFIQTLGQREFSEIERVLAVPPDLWQRYLQLAEEHGRSSQPIPLVQSNCS